MTNLLLAKSFTIVALFLSLAETRSGYAGANRLALNCEEQQAIKLEYSAKWDKAGKKATLKIIEKEQEFSAPFSLLVDFKRKQALYSEEGAYFVMDIAASNANQINLFFSKNDELGSELMHVDLNRNTLSFKSKYILDWDTISAWDRKGQCRSVSESEMNYQKRVFPEID
ncbi:hypothetical protein Syncc8109_0605 [Synechococcus sp. WH 8109]|uniref:hypothetical protein n=1 Tax=Synechococcus sp. WH 8109 TaxID=166314 RepID=UPI0003E014F5|nr:hypothetical protein [Synechococcus sp. WH 8109]AHF62992.1 hypothetical protein Syncc8109_0605 [Synechococcus sp. WH 8109]